MIEKIYSDFTTQLLPKISEGLVITKDYFFEFFGRYVKYLIVMDSMWIFIGLVGIVACIIYAKKIVQWQREDRDVPVILILIFPLIIFISMFFIHFSNLAKDVFVPEIRVIEKMSEYIK